MKNKIIHELKEHIPFTAFATIFAVIITIIFSYFLKYKYSENIFEISHILHVFFSAFATTIVFHKYNKSIIKGLLVGVFGSILIGTLSDVIFPYLGSFILNLNPHIHFPIIEKPIIIILSALFGILAGTKFKKTKFPHLLHVLISVFASLFYIISFANINTLSLWIVSFIITFISVLIPCCLSDIIFPILFIKKTK